jgi:hypothetical protein
MDSASSALESPIFSGLVVQCLGQSCFLIEMDETRDLIFAHPKFVRGRKYLHLHDRVRFQTMPNPRRDGELMAFDIEIVGLMITRQVSAQGARS